MIKATDLQSKILEIPENWNVALPGGRGGGKSYAVILMMARHLVKYGAAAKILIVRENYKGLQQIEQTTLLVMNEIFPDGVKFNSQDHILRAGGGTIEFGQLESARDAGKYLGREVTLLIFEEAGQLRSWKWVTQLKSGLRSPAGVPLRTCFTANPGDDMHAHIYRTYIAGVLPWRPFEVDGETWVTVPSVMTDNPFIDHADYKKRLIAAYPGDPERQAAMINNSWAKLKAGYFFQGWEPRVHILPYDLPFPITRAWAPTLSMDYGSSAPCITLFGGICPGDVPGIPRGSWVIFDEVSTADMEDPNLNSSMNWPLSKICEEITSRCRDKWQMHATGVADDAVGFLNQNDTLIKTLRDEYHINMRKPQKGRIQALARITDLLANAVLKNGKPGLYISQRAIYLLATLPIILRDKVRREDCRSDGPDHGVDSLMYMINSETPFAKIGINYHSGLVPSPGSQSPFRDFMY